MPGRGSCRTSRRDVTTGSSVPQVALILLHLTAQRGSAEEDSRLAGKEMLLHLEKRCLLQMGL